MKRHVRSTEILPIAQDLVIAPALAEIHIWLGDMVRALAAAELAMDAIKRWRGLRKKPRAVEMGSLKLELEAIKGLMALLTPGDLPSSLAKAERSFAKAIEIGVTGRYPRKESLVSLYRLRSRLG